MADEDPSYTALAMDRSGPIGNSLDVFTRRAAHVKIGNKPTEPIPVTIENDSPANETKNIYDEALAVASGSEETVVSYTVPADKFFYLVRADFAGTNIADWKLKLNGVKINRKYTWFSGPLYGSFDYETEGERGLKLSEGDEIEVTVIHVRPSTGDFNATIFGVERPE